MIFRCDGGPTTGLGHVVGAIRLAERVGSDLGIAPRFLHRPDRGTASLIADAGFSADVLAGGATPKEDVTRLIHAAQATPSNVAVVNFSADHLQRCNNLFHLIPDSGTRLVFQDNPVAPGWRVGDVVINALPHPAYGGYDPDTHPYCLDGLAYFLPDPRAEALRAARPARTFEEVQRVLVAMGGGASGAATCAVLDGLTEARYTGTVDVVMGRAASDVKAVQARLEASGLQASLTVGATDLAARMLAADLGFSALGLTTYEMAHAGLPTLLLTTSELNTCTAVNYCAEYGAAEHIGRLGQIAPAAIGNSFRRLTEDSARRASLSEHGVQSVGTHTRDVTLAIRTLVAPDGTHN